MTLRFRCALALAILFFAAATSRVCQADPWALETTQRINAGLLAAIKGADMALHSLEQYTNLKNLAAGEWEDLNEFMQLIESGRQVVENVSKLAYTIDNLPEEFKKQFSGFEVLADRINSDPADALNTIADALKQYSENNLKNIQATMEAVKYYSDTLQDDMDKLKKKQQMAKAEIGRGPLLKIQTQFAGQQVEELMKLRETLYLLGHAINYDLATKQDMQAKDQAAAMKLLEGCKPMIPEPGRYTPFKPPTSQYTWP